MGTNYFLKQKKCNQCGKIEEGTHIGKSSAGWKFNFQANKFSFYKNIEELKIWLKGKSIYNEYGEFIPKKKFWDMVEAKQKYPNISMYKYIKENPDYDNGSNYLIDDYEFTDADFS